MCSCGCCSRQDKSDQFFGVWALLETGGVISYILSRLVKKISLKSKLLVIDVTGNSNPLSVGITQADWPFPLTCLFSQPSQYVALIGSILARAVFWIDHSSSESFLFCLRKFFQD